MGSNFHIGHSYQVQQRLILCTPHQLTNCMPRKCISAILLQNPTIQSSVHQQLMQIVSDSFHRTVILKESYGIFTSPSPSSNLSIHFTIKLLPYVTYSFVSLLESSKQLKNKFVPFLLRKRSWTARIELCLTINQATGIR